MPNFWHDLSWVLPLRSDILTPIMEGLSALGYMEGLLAILLFGYVGLSKPAFSRLIVVFILSAIVNSFLKDLFQDPRPPMEFRLDPQVGESYGMPSGHSQIAVVMWIWLAIEARRGWVWLVCSLLAAGICFSRLYLGVHDVEDVVTGASLGFLGIVLFYYALKIDALVKLAQHKLIGPALIIIGSVIDFAIWPEGGHPGGVIALLLGTALLSFRIGQMIEQANWDHHPASLPKGIEIGRAHV